MRPQSTPRNAPERVRRSNQCAFYANARVFLGAMGGGWRRRPAKIPVAGTELRLLTRSTFHSIRETFFSAEI